MRALHIYSTFLIIFCVVSLVIGLVAGTTIDKTTDLWAVVLFAPVVYYLIKQK